MTVPRIAVTEPAGPAGAPLLVLGSSLGTSRILWDDAVPALSRRFRILLWDLPGHGSSPAVREPFTVGELADAVAAALDELGERIAFYAGVSLGGAVGLELLLRHPDRIRRAAIVCSAARIGTPEAWADRAAHVRVQGTASLVVPSAQRWFAPGSIERRPVISGRLLHALRDADDESYALCCEALAGFDARASLGAVDAPVLVMPGEEDPVIPLEDARELAAGVRDGRVAPIAAAGHLAPAEQPERVIGELLSFFAEAGVGEDSSDVAARAAFVAARESADGPTDAVRFRAGMATRREVLGAEHVDRAGESITKTTRDFQDFITRTAWGDIWQRPGLDRRSRSIAVITSLIAHGHHEELAMHLRAAIRNGLTREEIVEVILQSAIYSGVPAANTAFRIAQRVFDDDTGTGTVPGTDTDV